MLRIFVCIAIVAGCHHDAPAPATPLPPSTGTPIGYLIDAATDLKLTPQQVSDLRGVDEILKLRLDEIDHQAKPKKAVAAGSGSSAPPVRGRMGGHHRGRGPTGTSGTPVARGPSGATSGVDVLRADVVRSAITAAFGALDPSQQVRAKKVLEDHDVDWDTGSTDEQQIDPPEP